MCTISKSTNVGENIKILREKQNISRQELAETAGISLSHLEKIETGAREPGMKTYRKILGALKTNLIMFDEIETVQEKCVVKAQEILMECTEKQAMYLIEMMQFSAKFITEKETV